MKKPILKLEGVSKFYTSGTNVVIGLNGVSLSFHRGEFVAITGESGSGKSTMSSVLGGILPYESGELFFGGSPTSHFDSSDWERYRRDNISFISQNYGILAGATVEMNVISALRLAGMEKEQAAARSQEILEQVELWDLRHRRAAKLSSGQKQRLSIARALAKPAAILIADEPTGNLDPENSAKVIELLAQAAKSRLVLLVTHEFDEVKDHATRHVRLQDGRVVLDTSLRPAHEPEDLPSFTRGKRDPMSLYVTGLQLRSRPVWDVLMTFLFALTAFAVFAFLGTFIVALDDTDTRIYDNSAFANGSRTRIVASNMTQTPMDQEDYDRIANVEYVTGVERCGYVADFQYAYRKDVDYVVRYSQSASGNAWDPSYSTVIEYTVQDSAPYMQTVPVLPQGEVFITDGKMPEGFYEVIAARGEGLAIGENLPVFLVSQDYWGRGVYLRLNFTVVGLTDHGTGLYFSQRVGTFIQQVTKVRMDASLNLILPEDTSLPFMYEYLEEYLPEGFNHLLQDNQGRVHYTRHDPQVKPVDFPDELDWQERLAFTVTNVNTLAQGLDPLSEDNLVTLYYPESYYVDVPWDVYNPPVLVTASVHNINNFPRIVEVSQNTFDKLTWQLNCEQVSITIEDYAYTDRVIEALTDLGYVALSPFQLGSTQIDEEKGAQREQTLSICLVALLAVVALQVVLLRAMFSAQTESYRLLSNIGLISTTAKWSILWQFLLFTLLGQLLGAGGLWLCAALKVERIVHVLRYLPLGYVALLCAVHLTAAMLAALWVNRALVKQVYPQSGSRPDLDLEEKEAAV